MDLPIVFLEGVKKEEVEEWVKVADESYRKTEEGRKLTEKAWIKKQEKNPIQIK